MTAFLYQRSCMPTRHHAQRWCHAHGSAVGRDWEAMTCLRERITSERQDLDRLNLEHQRFALAVRELEREEVIVHLVAPAAVPFAGPCLCQPSKDGLVGF